MCEIIVGTVCLITGIVVVVIAKTSDSKDYRTIGEGIWAPIFVSLIEMKHLYPAVNGKLVNVAL